MRVLELLDEIEEIIENSSGFPLTGKILVDAEEILELIREVRVEMPEEIQQAQWIKDERQRILDEAKVEYENILKEARQQAENLIENDDITVKARARADEVMRAADDGARNLKLSTFEYIDNILYNFQDKMDQMYGEYFNDMYAHIQKTFDQINHTLTDNRNEIKEMSYRTEAERR